MIKELPVKEACSHMLLCVPPQTMWCLGERDGGIVNHVLTEYLGSRPGLKFYRMIGISRDTKHTLCFGITR